MDKISLSLWDVFNFLMSGALAFAALLIYLVLNESMTIRELADAFAGASSASIAVASPLAFILTGMIIEPFSNYFDKATSKVIKKAMDLLRKISAANRDSSRKESECKKSNDIDKENEALTEEIRKVLSKSLPAKIDNPFHICKDYIEKKNSSNSYAIFLARFGFYRNCSFIFTLLAIGIANTRTELIEQSLIFISFAAAAAVFKARSGQFFSYQAPAVFRAFLVETMILNEKSLRDDAR